MKQVLLLIILTACQSHYSKPVQVQRSLASNPIFRRFIQQVSQQTKMSTDDIERSIMSYIKSRGSNSVHGNYQMMGITKRQADQIRSLSDDLPFMPKVRKWAMENLDKIQPLFRRAVVADVYQQIVIGQRGLANPYTFRTLSTTSRRARRQAISPIRSISEKQERLLASIQDIGSMRISRDYRRNLASFQARATQNPAVLANGQEIVESATLISRKTGLKAMGDGCEDFTKTASIEVLEAKANLDIYRADLVEQMAHNKANRTFASASDIPSGLRLTADEVDQATLKSLQDVLGYTDDEARIALQRLKSKPCKLY